MPGITTSRPTRLKYSRSPDSQLCFNFGGTEVCRETRQETRTLILTPKQTYSYGPDFQLTFDFEHTEERPIVAAEKRKILGEDVGASALATASQPRINYLIIADNLGVGGLKTKFARNLEAIRLLKAIEGESRLATPEEQGTLSRYVGWGGLPQAFDGNNPDWSREYAGLKELLNNEEYNAARGSTLNAHYTAPWVARLMFETLGRMGFRKGNILEPSCGIGNFFGVLPKSMACSKLYGVELDSLTGRIAKQLYQNANITIEGFERTRFPDNFFDIAIGNVPFGGYRLVDAERQYDSFLIHDYFFAKSLDKIRPGGIIAFITSKGTMDKANAIIREYLVRSRDKRKIL